jgi:zinc and cadmium transporter
MAQVAQLALLLGLCFLGSFVGLIGGIALLWKEKFARKMSFFFISFAAGALLGAAFFDLLPEALGLAQPVEFVWIAVLASIILFSITERLLVWHHHHENHYKEHPKSKKPYGPLVIAGDTIHNFIDGVVIAAALLISMPLGIITALAVFFHEIPQEVGDFSVLLHAGYSRMQVIGYNILSAAATFVGALGVFFFASSLQTKLPFLLAFAAGGFIYIAAADLLPELKHEASKLPQVIVQTALMILGMVVMIILSAYFGV